MSLGTLLISPPHSPVEDQAAASKPACQPSKKRSRDDSDDDLPFSPAGAGSFSWAWASGRANANTAGPLKKTRQPLPSDADALPLSPTSTARPVPLRGLLVGEVPIVPAAPVGEAACLLSHLRQRYPGGPRQWAPHLNCSWADPVAAMASFNNLSRYAPGRSAFLLVVPAPSLPGSARPLPVDQHIWALAAVLPELLAAAPTLQPLVIDVTAPSDRPGSAPQARYPLPTAQLGAARAAGRHDTLISNLGLLHPTGGSVASSTLPAIVLVDRYFRRRLVAPVGWGAGAMWSGITPAGAADPLSALAADVSAAEMARRLLDSLYRGVVRLEREAATDSDY